MNSVEPAQFASADAWWWSADHWLWAIGMHGLSFFLLAGLIAAAVIVLLRRPPGRGEAVSENSPAAILDARYARGEIGRDEYLERKRDLRWRSDSV